MPQFADYRGAGGLRDSIRKSFETLKAEMDANLMLRPTRMLIMDEET